MKDEALKLALDALITITDAIYVNSQQEADAVYKANDAITAIKAALAQPAQELWAGVDFDIKLTPPQRLWVDLTEDEIEVIEEKALTKQWAIRMALASVKERNA